MQDAMDNNTETSPFEARRNANIEINKKLLEDTTELGRRMRQDFTELGPNIVSESAQSDTVDDPFTDTPQSIRQPSQVTPQRFILLPPFGEHDMELQTTPTRQVRFEQPRVIESMRAHSLTTIKKIIDTHEQSLADKLSLFSLRLQEAESIIQQLQFAMEECGTLFNDARTIHSRYHQDASNEMEQIKSAWKDVEITGLANQQTVRDNIAEASNNFPQWTRPDSLQTHPKWPSHWDDLKELKQVLSVIDWIHIEENKPTKELSRPASHRSSPMELCSDDEHLARTRRSSSRVSERHFTLESNRSSGSVTLRERRSSENSSAVARSKRKGPPLTHLADKESLQQERFLTTDQVDQEFVTELDGRFFVIRCDRKECAREGGPRKFSLDPMKHGRAMTHFRRSNAHDGEDWSIKDVIDYFSYDVIDATKEWAELHNRVLRALN